MSESFKLSSVSCDQWIEKIAQFRFEVWRANEMIDLSLFPEQKCLEDVDYTAIHTVIESEGNLVAASRFTSYPDIHSTHLGDYYQKAGIKLEGAIGIPEHPVVQPNMVGKGLHRLIIAEIERLARERSLNYTISECTEAAAQLLLKSGRKSLGKAPKDPRFPDIEFEWIVTDYTAESHTPASAAE